MNPAINYEEKTDISLVLNMIFVEIPQFSGFCDGITVAAMVLPSQTSIFQSGGGKTQGFGLIFVLPVKPTGFTSFLKATFYLVEKLA